jgi:exopolysaccharide biosynthesis polyprenyl glycosylphosphotransferase
LTQSLPGGELAATSRIEAPGAASRGDTALPTEEPASRNAVGRRASAGHKTRDLDRARLAVDIGALALAAVVADAGEKASLPVAAFAVYDLFVILLLATARSYLRRFRIDTFDNVRAAVVATSVAAIVLLAVANSLMPDRQYDSLWFDLWALSLVTLVIGRVGLNAVELRRRRRGTAGARTIIVGAGLVGRLTARRLLAHPEFGLRPIGFVDSDPMNVYGQELPVPMLGESLRLESTISEHQIDCVLVTFSSAPHDAFLRLLDDCERLGVRSLVVPRLFERVPSRLEVTHAGGLPLIETFPAHPHSTQYAVKYAIDRIVAAALLILLSPIMVAITAAVALSLGRPILYRQRRVGRDGHEFQMLKFRTMRPLEGDNDQALEFAGDLGPGGVEGIDRRTGVGSFLRKSSLDELPQLFNVAKGEMSLVGPRPERPEFVEYFGSHVRRYDARHRVKSGITGWAQVHDLRGKTSIADRVEWDNYYIENFSLLFDLKILLLTIPVVLRADTE